MSRSLIKSDGFSLIEVLVTLVLITIGVLGMVALQSKSIAFTQDTTQRNTAAMLAQDALELMRAQGKVSEKKKGDAFTAVDSCTSTPSEADKQLGCWSQEAARLLPGVDADLLTNEFQVCKAKAAKTCDADGTTVEIQLAWRVRNGECMDSQDADADKGICRYRLRSEL
ncbi:type IV pilus modification protein PilV [Pseudomonas oryzihabitans]